MPSELHCANYHPQFVDSPFKWTVLGVGKEKKTKAGCNGFSIVAENVSNTARLNREHGGFHDDICLLDGLQQKRGSNHLLWPVLFPRLCALDFFSGRFLIKCSGFFCIGEVNTFLQLFGMVEVWGNGLDPLLVQRWDDKFGRFTECSVNVSYSIRHRRSGLLRLAPNFC